MPGQLSAAQLNRSDEAIARTSALDGRNHPCDGAGPYLGRYLAVDSAVRDDFRIPLGDRRKDQHAGTLFGEVDAVRQELMHGFRVCPPPHAAFWNDAEADLR